MLVELTDTTFSRLKLRSVLPCKDREGSDIMLIRYSEMRREDKREKKQRDPRWGEAALPPSLGLLFNNPQEPQEI